MWRKFQAWRKGPKSLIEEWIEAIIVVVPLVFLIKTFVFGLYQVPTCSMENTMLVGERFFADKVTPYIRGPYRGEIIAICDPQYDYSKNYFVNLFERYVDWRIDNWTKRVIGIPGDHIQGKIEDGKPVVYVNDQKLHEPYLNNLPILFTMVSGQGAHPHPRTYDPAKPYEQQPYYRFDALDVTRARRFQENYGLPALLYPQTCAMRGQECLDNFDVQLGENQYWLMGDNRLGSHDSRAWGPLDGKLIHGRILFRIWSIDSNESWWIVDLLKHPIDFWKRIRWNRFLQGVY
jgi:signal peptidase I